MQSSTPSIVALRDVVEHHHYDGVDLDGLTDLKTEILSILGSVHSTNRWTKSSICNFQKSYEVSGVSSPEAPHGTMRNELLMAIWCLTKALEKAAVLAQGDDSTEVASDGRLMKSLLTNASSAAPSKTLTCCVEVERRSLLDGNGSSTSCEYSSVKDRNGEA